MNVSNQLVLNDMNNQDVNQAVKSGVGEISI